ncbi:MAG: molybdenum cofactor guanylyltransferase [Acidiphilium sp. 37-64-53]|uniref:molybdenum cofactor guanylyltransferase MobA n=1 Tax=Acidiphilium TaxID=522 RepID=UPI000BCF404C|nr:MULTISPECIES: molybdenum cofactor guanylyltransferase MobA [unclassified Acidiphilium]OYW04201.1 MAG: molybdenum cofactor guanylyltransferase [Acidiphilium sp. 37-64-53]OZB31132.1 MAG: molybdenum cofactor guanylyltransferase [Acidiphilium sp. 34-64-41]HQT83450.1 molybdenum cofactor guanylyltransferase MobA [Acidiphilium rubrum]
MTAVYGLILAGGAGRRLGGVDKAFVGLWGRPLVAHVVERLAGQAEGLVISAAGDVSRFDLFGLPVVGDGAHRGKGPLAGLLAGLRWAAALGGDFVVSVPVDTPFVPLDLVARLGDGPAVAAYGGRVHHLVARWPVAAAGALEEFLCSDGPYRVSDFARGLGMRVVEFADRRDPFMNINTPEDLALAEGLRC